MAFMEATLGEGFLNDLDLRHPMAMLIIEVITHAPGTRHWGEGPALPEPVLARTLQVLGELYEDVSDFLAGAQEPAQFQGSVEDFSLLRVQLPGRCACAVVQPVLALPYWPTMTPGHLPGGSL